jgi:glycosyltransferase involved in cell wall biosynthesis
MILEAMAAGKATVVARTGGLPDLVGDGASGICVPPLNIDALAAAMDYLVDHESFRRQIGMRARARATERHNPGRIAQAWRNVLLATAGVRAKAGQNRNAADEKPSSRITGVMDGVPARQY